jgi:hypothetical protein
MKESRSSSFNRKMFDITIVNSEEQSGAWLREVGRRRGDYFPKDRTV